MGLGKMYPWHFQKNTSNKATLLPLVNRTKATPALFKGFIGHRPILQKKWWFRGSPEKIPQGCFFLMKPFSRLLAPLMGFLLVGFFWLKHLVVGEKCQQNGDDTLSTLHLLTHHGWRKYGKNVRFDIHIYLYINDNAYVHFFFPGRNWRNRNQKNKFKIIIDTLPETNIAPKSLGLEDGFPFAKVSW